MFFYREAMKNIIAEIRAEDKAIFEKVGLGRKQVELDWIWRLEWLRWRLFVIGLRD
jgi:hypothetical protein